MRISFTSTVWQEMSDIVRSVLANFEDRVNYALENEEFGTGIDSFLAVLIAVDEIDNSRFATRLNRFGYVKDFEGNRFAQVSISVEISPDLISGKTLAEVLQLFTAGLIRQLDKLSIKTPKEFCWISFVEKLKCALLDEQI
jgi:hypothetical protein